MRPRFRIVFRHFDGVTVVYFTGWRNQPPQTSGDWSSSPDIKHGLIVEESNLGHVLEDMSWNPDYTRTIEQVN